MQRISLKVDDHIYQELELKARELELSLSDIMRKCLKIGLKHFKTESPPPVSLEKNIYQIQKRIAVHVLFTHSLIEHFIKGTIANGNELCDLAESTAEKMLVTMLENGNRGKNGL